MRMRLVARLFSISFSLMVIGSFSSAGFLWAQETGEDGDSSVVAGEEKGKISPEASAYLLDISPGGSDVEILWDGYWRISFVAGGNFGKEDSENTFPGLSQGVSFFQEPDVTLSLWLNNRWFIETSFMEGFERNSYRAGYVGEEDEFVREVVVGNTGINATSYAEIEVPAPRYNTPGIVAKFGTPTSDHELLLRFDATESDTKVFQGEFEVNTQDIGLPDFVEGKYFILPDENVTNVRVYLEDRLGSITGTSGTGTVRRYRLADPVEYFVDGATGLLVLDEAWDGQVVAYYDSAFGPVGTGGGGADFIVPADANNHPSFEGWDGNPGTLPGFLLDFDWAEFDEYDPEGTRTYLQTSSVNLGTETGLILYTPGRFSPFERQNLYESSRPLPDETWRIVPLIRDRGALYPSTTPEYGFIPDIEDKTIAVYGQVGQGLRYPSNRYPFAGADPEVYGPGRETDMDKISRIIVLAIRETNPGYSLGSGIVPGSAVVRVNGVRDKTAEVSDDGRISFTRFIYPDDWIEVSFRTEVLDFDGGDLFVYQGNRFQLAPNLTLELAENIRWNISEDRTVEEFDQSPGQIKIATTLDWKTEVAGLRLTGDAALSTPDTAGNLRLFGTDEEGLYLYFLTTTLVGSPDTFPGAPSGSRQPADKYEYTSYDNLGREILNDYLWPGAGSTGDDGPALAARQSGDPTSGRVMDLRFDVPASEWAAGDFLADENSPIDLSGYTAIEFPIRFLDSGSGIPSGSVPRVVLQAGEIGETEDHQEDGSVDQPDAGAMVEWDLSGAAADWETGNLGATWASGEWNTVRFTLTPAMRARLGSVRAFRLIIDNITVSNVTGRAVMGAPLLVGSPFRTEIRTPSDDLAVVQNIAGDVVIDNGLKSAFPEVEEIFHPDGEDNRSLRVRWGVDAPGGAAVDANDRWEAVSWFTEVPLTAYRTMVFYVRDEVGIRDMTAEATDENGKGIRMSWDSLPGNVSPTGWDRITVDISDRTASSASGNAVTSFALDSDAGNLTRFVLKGTDAAGSAPAIPHSGTIYLDEIHFRDPAYTVTGGAELRGFWRHEEDVLSVGSFPVLGDISLDGRAQLAGGKVMSGVDQGNTAVTGSITASAVVAGVKLDTDWRGTWGPGQALWSGSHNLRIPARNQTFWITDLYAQGDSGDSTSFSRLNDINLALSPGKIRAFTEAMFDGASLIQTWGGETSWAGKGWKTDLDVRYVLNTADNTGETGNYFSSWLKNYALILPAEGTTTNRESHHTLDALLQLGPASVEWDPSLRMKASRAPFWNQDNQWQGTLSVPLEFEKWSLTPSYRRDLKQLMDTGDDEDNRSYGDIWTNFTGGFSGQFPLFTYLPFRELFGSTDGDTFADVTLGMVESTYETEFVVDLSRPGGSRIFDIFLPSSGQFSMERRYERKGDTSGWENEWRGSLGFSAINLFGSFGRFPIMNFYTTEELSSLLQITLADYNGTTAPDPEEVLWQVNWSFSGVRNRRMVLDHRLSWNWDTDIKETRQEGRLEYQWQTASKDVLQLPLINRVIPRQHHLENKERLIVTGIYPWDNAPAESELELAFTLYHESRWVFQDNGHIKGWLALGAGDRDGEFINGWELGLEAELRF